MHLRALAPPALLVAAALALSATPAGAIMHLYTGTLDGTVALHVSEVSNGGLQTRRLNAALQLHATLPKLQFSDGRFVSQEAGGTVSASGVDLHYLGINRDVDPVDVVDCRTNAVTLTSPPVATPLASFLRTVPPTTIDLIPTTMFDFGRIACGGGWATIAFGARTDYLEPLQQSHFHARIEVPREQLGDSDITLPFTRVGSGAEKCPWTQYKPDLVSCTTLWRGVLRLKRAYSSEIEFDDDLALAPLIPSRRAKLDRRATRASVAARCPRGCGVEIKVFLPPRRGRGRLRRGLAATSAAGRLLARHTVRLPAGAAERTVTVAIPARHRAALRAAGRARIEVSADPPQGRTVRRALTLTVGG